MKRKRRWLVGGGIVLVAGLLVGLLGLIVVTRPGFIRSQVFPRVEDATGLAVRAEGIGLSLLRGFSLTGVSIGPELQPLLTAEEVRCRYGFWRTIRGAPLVEEFVIDGAVLHLIRDTQGRLNIPASPGEETGAMPADGSVPAEAAAVPALLLRNIRVQDMTVIYEQAATAGAEAASARIESINVTVDRIAPGAETTVTLGLRLARLAAGTVNVSRADLAGTLTIGFSPTLAPTGLAGQLTVDSCTGRAGDVVLTGRALRWDVAVEASDGAAYSIQTCRLTGTADGVEESVVKLFGDVTPSPFSADINWKLERVSAGLLNLAAGLGGGVSLGGSASLEGFGNVQVSASDGTVHSSSSLDLKGAMVSGAGVAPGALPALGVRIKERIMVYPERQRALVTGLEMRVNEGRHTALRLVQSAPLELSWADADGAATASPARLDLQIDDLPLALANAFLPPDTAGIHGGVLRGSLELRVEDLGRGLGLAGSLTVPELDATVAGERIEGARLSANLAVTLADYTRVNLERITLTAAGQEGPVLPLQATGTYDLKAATGQLDVALPSIRSEALRALLPASWFEPADLGAYEVAVQSRAVLTEESGPLLSGTVTVPRFVPDAPEGIDLPVFSGESAFCVQQTDLGVSVTQLDLSAKAGDEPILDASVVGTVALPPTSGPTRVHVTSELIDGRLLALAAPGPETDSDAPSPAPPVSTEPPEPVDLTGMDIEARLGLNQIRHGGLDAAVAGTVVVRDNAVNTDDLRVTVNESPISLVAGVDFKVPGYAYRLQAKAPSIDLGRLLADLTPPEAGQISGVLEGLDLQISGRGTDSETIRRHLQGDVGVSVGSLRLLELPALVETAEKMGYTSLRDLQFSGGEAALSLAPGGRVDVSELSVTGSNLVLALDGDIGLDGTQALALRAGVGGDLRQQVVANPKTAVLRVLGRRDADHLYVPIPLYIGGTVTNPKVDAARFRTSFSELLTDDVIARAAELGIDTSGWVGEKAVRILEAGRDALGKDGGTATQRIGRFTGTVLGTILDPGPGPGDDGAADAETPAPGNQEERPKLEDQLEDAGRKLLRGLLGNE